MSALFSFLGGSVFRMIWGEASAYFTRKQEHAEEMALLELQEKIEDARHERNVASMQLQHQLGIETIQVQSEAAISKSEVDAWSQAVADVGRKTGIKFVDTWNGGIRPLLASMAIVMVFAEIVALGFMMTDWHKELFGAVLGLYVADRSLKHRGK